MVRTGSRAPSVGQNSVSKIRDRRKKAYKVQLESVVTKKKKLKLLDVQGSAKPKAGYTFLPVGYADLAERCKEKSRQLGVDVAVVSAGTRRPGIPDPQKLTHHVHRVGYHFRSDIFDQACNFLGYREVNGKLVRDTGFDTTSRFERTIARFAPRFDLNANNQTTEQSTKVKEYIRELFPKIPEDDLEEIYKRAWEQGTTTVGNASDLSLSRQVQLATIARIRHTYTDYDKLLRIVSWKEARQIVEPMSLTKLIEWRGEHDNDTEDFEEILRETIVIDDDDEEIEDIESDTDSTIAASVGDGSDTSLEILQQTLAPKDLNVAVGEKVRNAVASVGRAAGRVLPAAIQTRWQDARMRQRAIDKAATPHGHGGQISVPLDQRGNVPRKVVSNGVEYVRISSSPECEKELRPQPGVPGGWPTGDAMPLAGHHVPASTHGYQAAPSFASSDAPQYGGASHLQSERPMWQRLERRPMYPTLATSVVDLTSSAPRTAYGDRISYTGPPQFGFHPDNSSARVAPARRAPHRNVYRPGMADDDVVITGAQPRSQSHRHQPYNYGGGQERLEMVKPEDYPILSREDPGYPMLPPRHDDLERRDVNERPPPGITLQTRSVQKQPVFGQPAYPQMRSQTAMQAVARPVHGAPAAVQPMAHERAPSVGQAAPSFGAPSPPRYFMGSSHQPFYVPDR